MGNERLLSDAPASSRRQRGRARNLNLRPPAPSRSIGVPFSVPTRSQCVTVSRAVVGWGLIGRCKRYQAVAGSNRRRDSNPRPSGYEPNQARADRRFLAL